VSHAPIVDCRKALDAVLTNDNTDIDVTLQAAMAWLREKGRLRAASKAGRVAREGLIGVHLHQNHKSAVIMELNCETDFVAKSEPFQKVCVEVLESILSKVNESNKSGVFSIPINDAIDASCLENITQLSGQVGEKVEARRFFGIKLNEANSFIVNYMHNKVGNAELTSLGRIASVVLMQSENENGEKENIEVGKLLAMHIVAENPKYVGRDSIPPEELQKLKDSYEEEANKMGRKKPAHIMERIINGKLNKFFKQNLLLEQNFSLDETDDTISVKRYCDKFHTKPIDFLRLKVAES